MFRHSVDIGDRFDDRIGHLAALGDVVAGLQISQCYRDVVVGAPWHKQSLFRKWPAGTAIAEAGEVCERIAALFVIRLEILGNIHLFA